MYQPYMYNNPMQIIRVNGENGARALQMQPNSSVLLLDETGPIVWLAQTDGAGYKSVTPYKIEPYQKADEPSISSLTERIAKLEEAINGKSNSSDVKQTE